VVTDIGLIIKLRAEVDAFMHESELGDWGPLDRFKRGTELRAPVLVCDPAGRVLKLSLKKGGYVIERKTRAEELEAGAEYAATVKKFLRTTDAEGWVGDGGAFVDLGCQFEGFLATGSGVPPAGREVTVRVLEFDLADAKVRRRIPVELVAEGPPAAARGGGAAVAGPAGAGGGKEGGAAAGATGGGAFGALSAFGGGGAATAPGGPGAEAGAVKVGAGAGGQKGAAQPPAKEPEPEEPSYTDLEDDDLGEDYDKFGYLDEF